MSDKDSDLTEEELKECEEFMSIFDRDQNERVTDDELLRFFQSLDYIVKLEDVQQILKKFDLNKDGILDFHEFVLLRKAIKRSCKRISGTDLEAAFKIFDRDDSGYIDIFELETLLKKIGQPVSDDELKEMMAVVDRDKDDKISIKEFSDFIMTSSSKTSQKTMGQ